MKKINSDFISGFVKRGGFSVFFSTALVKICAALLSIIVVQLLPKDDYGVLSYVLSIYAIAIVVAGLGGNYSLLRFGSIVGSFLKKKQYYYYTQKVGIKYTSIVVAIIIVYSFFLPEGMKWMEPLPGCRKAFNLLTLPGILMISDFSYLSRNYKDKKCLKSYYCNYLKVVVPVSFILFLLLIIYGDFVVENLFGAQYNDCIYMYKMFMVATFVTYIFRNPLGNILLAVGKAKWNGYNTYIFCLLYIIFSFIFYQYWGVLAIVYCLCATFILSGFVSLYLFYYYIKSLK